MSNTSPLSNLAIIDRLELLREQQDRVIIPGAVRQELERLGHSAARVRIEEALRSGWLVVEETIQPVLAWSLRARIDEGEAEAIQLAVDTKADLLIIDDLLGRAVATECGLEIMGLIGVLMKALRAGRISAVRPEIDRLRREANFYLAPKFEAAILREAGE